MPSRGITFTYASFCSRISASCIEVRLTPGAALSCALSAWKAGGQALCRMRRRSTPPASESAYRATNNGYDQSARRVTGVALTARLLALASRYYCQRAVELLGECRRAPVPLIGSRCRPHLQEHSEADYPDRVVFVRAPAPARTTTRLHFPSSQLGAKTPRPRKSFNRGLLSRRRASRNRSSCHSGRATLVRSQRPMSLRVRVSRCENSLPRYRSETRAHRAVSTVTVARTTSPTNPNRASGTAGKPGCPVCRALAPHCKIQHRLLQRSGFQTEG